MIVSTGRVLTGPAGTATEVLADLEPDDRPDHQGTVASWFVHAPGQSLAWHHYSLGVVHLRPIPGQSHPPYINVAGATHEVFLLALNLALNPVADNPRTWRHLTPINVCEQVHLPTDELAAELGYLAAEAIVEGMLPAEPPLAGAVEPWRTALVKTAAHLRGEEHAP